MKKRLSSFELLRIIAMFLIVLHHAIVHGLWFNINNYQIINNPEKFSLTTLLGLGGEIGVYLFVLITGYFMINSKIKINKVVKLWLPVLFWSVITCILSGIILKDLSIINLIKAYFPIVFDQYWFMTTYIFMYMLIPFLNLIVLNINGKHIILFLLIGFLIVFNNPLPYEKEIWSNLMTFCVVYCIGGLIRQNKEKIKKERYILWTFSIYLLVAICAYGIIKIATVTGKYNLASYAREIVGLRPLVIVCAIFLFLGIGLFSNISYKPVINKTAGLMFGIYLISDSNGLRNLIWLNVFRLNHVFNSQSCVITFVYPLLATVLVFVCCGVIEYLRKLVFTNFENKISKEIEKTMLKQFQDFPK